MTTPNDQNPSPDRESGELETPTRRHMAWWHWLFPNQEYGKAYNAVIAAAWVTGTLALLGVMTSVFGPSVLARVGNSKQTETTFSKTVAVIVPEGKKSVWAYTEPTTKSTAVYELKEPMTVVIKCQLDGEPIQEAPGYGVPYKPVGVWLMLSKGVFMNSVHSDLTNKWPPTKGSGSIPVCTEPQTAHLRR